MSDPETIPDDYLEKLLAEIHVFSQGEVVLRHEQPHDDKESYDIAVVSAKSLNQKWAKHAINGDIELALMAMEKNGWIQRGEYNSYTSESIVQCMRVVNYVQNTLWKQEGAPPPDQVDMGGTPASP